MASVVVLCYAKANSSRTGAQPCRHCPLKSTPQLESCPRCSSSSAGMSKRYIRRRFKQSCPPIPMPHGSGERGIARVAGSVSSVESRWVRFIQSGSELQPPW